MSAAPEKGDEIMADAPIASQSSQTAPENGIPGIAETMAPAEPASQPEQTSSNTEAKLETEPAEPKLEATPEAMTATPGSAKKGVPTRTYLNDQVTPVLLEGMRLIAKDRPSDPLGVLGQYLLDHRNNGSK